MLPIAKSIWKVRIHFMSIESPIVVLVDTVGRLLKNLRLRLNLDPLAPFSPSISIEYTSSRRADERIERLEDARKALSEGLQAVEDLKQEAEKNKQDSVQALATLAKLREHNASLSQQIEASKTIIESDIDAFRKIAGIPSEREQRRDKLLGFWTGVLASIVAAVLWALGSYLWNNIRWCDIL